MKLPPLGQLGPFIALAIACVFFAFTTERFFSGRTQSLIPQQVMVVGVIAIGQTLIILTAGIDLSCGMVMALGSIVMTKFARRPGTAHRSLPCSAASASRRSSVCSNGLLVTRIVAAVHRHPGIVQHRLCDHAAVLQRADGDRPARRDDLARNTFLLRRRRRVHGVVLMIVLYHLATWFWLRETGAGATSTWWQNPEATRLVGTRPTACCSACTCSPASSTASPAARRLAHRRR